MFGWLSAAVARASWSKRWSRSASWAIALGSTFRATSRSSRVSRARNTSPIPPSPNFARISYGPRRVPTESGGDISDCRFQISDLFDDWLIPGFGTPVSRNLHSKINLNSEICNLNCPLLARPRDLAIEVRGVVDERRHHDRGLADILDVHPIDRVHVRVVRADVVVHVVLDRVETGHADVGEGEVVGRADRFAHVPARTDRLQPFEPAV